MSAPLNAQGNECCAPCPSPVVSQVPGPTGLAGAAGANGTNGISAFTTITQVLGFTVPGIGLNTTFSVGNTTWLTLGQIVAIPGAGYFQVSGVGGVLGTTQLKLTNPPAYSDINSVPGTNVPLGTGISGAGARGPTGATGISTLNGVSPTTTKGDIIVDNGANNPLANDIRFPVGNDGEVLTSQSGQPAGVAWQGIDLTGVTSDIDGALPIANGGTGQAAKGPAFDALSPMTTNGDIISRAAGVNSRIAVGTNGQLLTVVAGVPAWATPAVSSVLQLVVVSTNAYTTTVSTIPFDDTIPQSAEGTQLLTTTITPSNNTSRIVVECSISLGLTASDEVTFALFNGAANAIYATMQHCGNTGTVAFVHEFAPGAVTPLTVSLRIGSHTGVTIEFNGFSGGRLLGGAQRCWMTITEYA